MSASDTDQFHDLLDRWEDLREQGQEPSVEDLCRDAPHLIKKMQDWVRVLKMSEWMCKRADEVADETFGEVGTLSAEEKSKHQVIGEYTLLEELGGGGMGRVLKAVHRKMNRAVALKLLPQSLVQSPESVERFRREVQALARLCHPNIVAVHDAGEGDGTPFYVMDLVDGEDLARIVKEHGPMPVEQAVDCTLQTARGLEYAHSQGVVHRDIKPSNLILDRNGTIKILDLGIARFQPLPEQAADDLTKTGCVLGTVDYMAPEQAMNTRRADHRADIYSLGCTLYFLLTGQPLFGGETVMERVLAHREHAVPSLRKACPAAPPWLDAVFQKMVAKNANDRYQSVTALVFDLAQRLAPRRRKRWVGIAVLMMLVLVGGWLVVSRMWTSSLDAQMRKWMPKNGNESKAEFDKREGPVATLRKPDGTETNVRFGDLSDEDRHYIKQKKPAGKEEKPVGAAWRMKGEYPSLAGEWVEDEAGKRYVTITQESNEFVAKSNIFKLDDNDDHHYWFEGTISKDGHISGKFTSGTVGTMTGTMDYDGRTVRFHSKEDWGEGDWTLTLKGNQGDERKHAAK